MANLSSKTGFSPIQTQVNFSAVNSATSVQDFAAYDAQELQGFVYVNTTSTGALTLRASVKVMVVKNGAGTYEVASVDISGDNVAGNPIVSFSMSGSVLRATLSSSITGTWGSGYIRYQLSAPYLGGNYPLSVTASQVLGGTSAPAVGYIGEVRYGQPGSAVNFGATTAVTNITSVSLSKGTWLISGYASFNITSGTLTGAYLGLSVNSTDMEGNTYLNGTAPSNFTGASNMVTPIRVITVTADNTPHYLNGLLYYTTATGNYTTNCRITAIRIA